MSTKPIIAPPWVFLGPPWTPRGLWLRTDLSVLIPCPYATCQSKPMEPCRNQDGTGQGRTMTHSARRYAWRTRARVTIEVPAAFVNIAKVVRVKLEGESP